MSTVKAGQDTVTVGRAAAGRSGNARYGRASLGAPTVASMAPWVGGFLIQIAMYSYRSMYSRVFVCTQLVFTRLPSPRVFTVYSVEYDEFVPEYNGLVGHPWFSDRIQNSPEFIVRIRLNTHEYSLYSIGT